MKYYPSYGIEMQVSVNYKCLSTKETGLKTITVVDWEKKCVRDLKYAIQNDIHAPVCDQRLFHQGQLLANESMPLSRTYHRQGEAFSVEFLARANVPDMEIYIKTLKEHSQMIHNGNTFGFLVGTGKVRK